MTERVAIIAMSSLFPGSRDVPTFWDNLVRGVDSRRDAGALDLDLDPASLLGKGGAHDALWSLRFGFVDRDDIDAQALGLSAHAFAALSREQRWCLGLSRAVLANAGYLQRADVLARCGFVLGTLAFPTPESNAQLLPIYEQAALRAVSNAFGASAHTNARRWSPPDVALDLRPASALVAGELGLGGPHFVLDAACASALYAIDLGARMLRSGSVDLMLAGAVSAADPLFVAMGFSTFQAYPDNGVSTPLDESSRGLTPAEGAGIVLLKRLADARRDGDHVLATILGCGLSNDGRGKAVLSPSLQGQLRAYERAYRTDAIAPSSIDYVECHATGTDLGDRTELASMEAWFLPAGAAPRFGAVKGNVGHLLTAAGMPSLAKVIASMRMACIAPTAGVNAPRCSPQALFEAQRLVARPEAWPRPQGRGRRAAINAFGFGGCNAHLVLEQDASIDAPVSDADAHARAERAPLALTGIGMHFGACDDVQRFAAASYDATAVFRPLPPRRWKGLEHDPAFMHALSCRPGHAPSGAYLEDFRFDFMRFRVLPHAQDRPRPQQLLLLEVADAALRDAGLEAGGNVAVIVAAGMDLENHQCEGRVRVGAHVAHVTADLPPATRDPAVAAVKAAIFPHAGPNLYASMIGNISASRVSSHWDFSGPSFTLNDDTSSVFRALELAWLLLEQTDVTAVVVAGVELAASAESLYLRRHHAPAALHGAKLSLDARSDGVAVGEGAGAIVLERRADAQRRQARCWANLESMCLLNAGDARTVATAARRALQTAERSASDVDYVELAATGVAGEDTQEIAGLRAAFDDVVRHGCALGSAKALIGHTFAASGVASIIHAALCLHQRYLPGTPDWEGPKAELRMQDGPFHVLSRSRPWFRDASSGPRIASVSHIAHAAAGHLIMSEPEQRAHSRVEAAPVATQPTQLLPLAFDTPAMLLSVLGDLEQRIAGAASLSELTCAALADYRGKVSAPLLAAVLADSLPALSREISLLRSALGSGRCSEIATPFGSYVSLAPLGPEHGVTFVYPGAFNTYPEAGHELFRLFPEAFDFLARRASHGAALLRDPMLVPRGTIPADRHQAADALRQRLEQPASTFEHGIVLSVLYTDVVRHVLGIQPRAAFGSSMGEISMLYALGVWDRTDVMSERLRSSPLFRTELAGPMHCLRRNWQLDASEVPSDALWRAYQLSASAEEVRPHCAASRRVHLVLVHSPRTVVIAGFPPACERLIAERNWRAVEVPLSDVIHCDLVRPLHADMAALHDLPALSSPDARLFTAVGCRELSPLQTDLGRNIADMYCQAVDFAELTRTVYAEGARIFLELGPRDSCTRYIGETLHGQPHLAVSLDRKGIDGRRAMLQAVAKLLSHRVAVDFSRLHALQTCDTHARSPGAALVTVGGESIADCLPVAHEPRFAAASARA